MKLLIALIGLFLFLSPSHDTPDVSGVRGREYYYSDNYLHDKYGWDTLTQIERRDLINKKYSLKLK